MILETEWFGGRSHPIMEFRETVFEKKNIKTGLDLDAAQSFL
jgi:hypothetical protein